MIRREGKEMSILSSSTTFNSHVTKFRIARNYLHHPPCTNADSVDPRTWAYSYSQYRPREFDRSCPCEVIVENSPFNIRHFSSPGFMNTNFGRLDAQLQISRMLAANTNTFPVKYLSLSPSRIFLPSFVPPATREPEHAPKTVLSDRRCDYRSSLNRQEHDRPPVALFSSILVVLVSWNILLQYSRK